MNLIKYSITVILAALFTSSCVKEGRGFALPAGQINEGKDAYIRFECNACHSIKGIDWKEGQENLQIPLGGEIGRTKTYGELVTSVINPSHLVPMGYQKDSLGRSKMKAYNEVMSVQELVDIVTYLQSEYKIVTPPQYYYPY